MKSGKSHEEEDEAFDDFGSKKDATPSTNTKDGKNSDKASATRSKHSVTEQRRRSKINERFQILRELIPNSDQKRDTASFLLEVIDYVQYLQEKMQKYEGSYQGWSSEPTKLMPHWRVQSLVGNPQAVKNDAVPGSTYPGRFDENNVTILPSMHTNQQITVDSDLSRDLSCKLMEQQPELANKGMVMPMPLHSNMGVPIQGDGVFSHPLQRPVSDANISECTINGDAPSQHEDLTIEGGTISISSVYSQGLLNTLTQALESAGVDLTQATVSVQVDLGKRANRGLTSGISVAKDHVDPSDDQQVGHYQESNAGEVSDQVQKRQKI
ncbi:transcription factor BIM2 isoform X2 [Apium graveolens]|uniref:transcription factor BIM2 isoform X2 n=1 Tax=Apium graveolens TaxID=4045 RepID=UPI003D7A4982